MTPEQVMKMMLDGIEIKDELETKTNEELAELMREHFLNHLKIFSASYELVEQVCKRIDPEYCKD